VSREKAEGKRQKGEEESDPHEIPIEATLDLHTFAPRDIPSVVDEYIRAAHERGLREVRLIHGRGKGVQRGIVQNVLEKHPLVEEFWDAAETHLGATVARLVNAQLPTPNSQLALVRGLGVGSWELGVDLR
jgi:DNA-nicking Smr family endonuclease